MATCIFTWRALYAYVAAVFTVYIAKWHLKINVCKKWFKSAPKRTRTAFTLYWRTYEKECSNSSFDGFSQFLAFLVCLCAFQLFICTQHTTSHQHLCNRFNLLTVQLLAQRTKRVVGEMTKWIFVATYACIDSVNRNKEHDEKEMAKNTKAQSVRFTFDDVNIDGLHYSIHSSGRRS